MGQAEQDFQDRASRTAKIKQPGKVKKRKDSRKGQPEQDS
jgi:hypothetical protein